jgi:hypothetical protein
VNKLAFLEEVKRGLRAVLVLVEKELEAKEERKKGEKEKRNEKGDKGGKRERSSRGRVGTDKARKMELSNEYFVFVGDKYYLIIT